MKSIQEIQLEIIDVFSFLEDWEDKYSMIIDYGKQLEIYPEEFKKEDFLIKGCQSRVWLVGKLEDNGSIHYWADSDAIITKGLVALVLQIYNHQLPENILKANIDFFNEIGLSSHLSPTRASGLNEMIKRVKIIAQSNLK